jgi:hypothetical protein
VGFLRRLLGGGDRDAAEARDGLDEPGNAGVTPSRDTQSPEDEERTHELDLLRGEQERLDELAQRQLRYARYAWQPPSQGGDRRADDADDPGT